MAWLALLWRELKSNHSQHVDEYLAKQRKHTKSVNLHKQKDNHSQTKNTNNNFISGFHLPWICNNKKMEWAETRACRTAGKTRAVLMGRTPNARTPNDPGVFSKAIF